MARVHRRRQISALLFALVIAILTIFLGQGDNSSLTPLSSDLKRQYFGEKTALDVLETIETKGRAPKTGYSRDRFGGDWDKIDGCSVREMILARDLEKIVRADDCSVQSGTLQDPYTGKTIEFVRGPSTSQLVQIDHVVALSDAWQKGAQQLTEAERTKLANDPLNLLAVDGSTNQQKSDGDASTWLPPNKSFRCQYVARQVAVKVKYRLWMTISEKSTIKNILTKCTESLA